MTVLNNVWYNTPVDMGVLFYACNGSIQNIDFTDKIINVYNKYRPFYGEKCEDPARA